MHKFSFLTGKVNPEFHAPKALQLVMQSALSIFSEKLVDFAVYNGLERG
jgi:hypothetical protein